MVSGHFNILYLIENRRASCMSSPDLTPMLTATIYTKMHYAVDIRFVAAVADKEHSISMAHSDRLKKAIEIGFFFCNKARAPISYFWPVDVTRRHSILMAHLRPSEKPFEKNRNVEPFATLLEG